LKVPGAKNSGREGSKSVSPERIKGSIVSLKHSMIDKGHLMPRPGHIRVSRSPARSKCFQDFNIIGSSLDDLEVPEEQIVNNHQFNEETPKKQSTKSTVAHQSVRISQKELEHNNDSLDKSLFKPTEQDNIKIMNPSSWIKSLSSNTSSLI
jgi:hypothetical protein